MTPGTEDLRREIVAACRILADTGLTVGTSGNVSVRAGGVMLITPSATPYAELTAEMICEMPLDGPEGVWVGPRKPSTEWRFHRDILRARPEIGAVVHAHPPHCTALAMARREIPPCHYMIAAFGGASVRCAGYARYGTAELSALVLQALEGRTACLMANHGMIALGETLSRAMWRAAELEALARHYCIALSIGGPVLLSDAQIGEAAQAFATYAPGGA
ncbi:L-fuculose-phosphate aldolase [Albidovulum inexpectatum]|uniref:L-fuculose-phosphate aldolase n=1 Tax=Albidovulum inexpectatum TaxID=196587 RepID=A0A2S5JDA8_9RHOB|nr:class II aldolase/adducin family protein [Albidovulum inexpectatum]PPB79482.1 L-fuculose-phosphate aldolase [Albidovulum inexpectatum]